MEEGQQNGSEFANYSDFLKDFECFQEASWWFLVGWVCACGSIVILNEFYTSYYNTTKCRHIWWTPVSFWPIRIALVVFFLIQSHGIHLLQHALKEKPDNWWWWIYWVIVGYLIWQTLVFSPLTKLNNVTSQPNFVACEILLFGVVVVGVLLIALFSAISLFASLFLIPNLAFYAMALRVVNKLHYNSETVITMGFFPVPNSNSLLATRWSKSLE